MNTKQVDKSGIGANTKIAQADKSGNTTKINLEFCIVCCSYFFEAYVTVKLKHGPVPIRDSLSSWQLAKAIGHHLSYMMQRPAKDR